MDGENKDRTVQKEAVVRLQYLDYQLVVPGVVIIQSE